ncbi:MAG: RNA polymerase sigma factor [Woeseiaceae bacterium]
MGRKENSLDNSVELDAFLRSVERKAFVMARGMVADPDEALDIVQDAMLRFVRKYADRPEQEWRPLFFRIVINRARDIQRRRQVTSRIVSWFKPGDRDPIENAVASPSSSPEARALIEESMQELERGIRALSARQQQAFAFRCLEGMDVAATATAMGCSAGSVKTHYSRALAALRLRLGRVEHE